MRKRKGRAEPATAPEVASAPAAAEPPRRAVKRSPQKKSPPKQSPPQRPGSAADNGDDGGAWSPARVLFRPRITECGARAAVDARERDAPDDAEGFGSSLRPSKLWRVLVEVRSARDLLPAAGAVAKGEHTCYVWWVRGNWREGRSEGE
jgi:hypothetical protein